MKIVTLSILFIVIPTLVFVNDLTAMQLPRPKSLSELQELDATMQRFIAKLLEIRYTGYVTDPQEIEERRKLEIRLCDLADQRNRVYTEYMLEMLAMLPVPDYLLDPEYVRRARRSLGSQMMRN